MREQGNAQPSALDRARTTAQAIRAIRPCVERVIDAGDELTRADIATAMRTEVGEARLYKAKSRFREASLAFQDAYDSAIGLMAALANELADKDDA